VTGKRTLFIGLEGATFFVIPQTGEVGIQLRYPKDETGLVPRLELGIRLSPEEARRFSRLLVDKATEAEVLAIRRQ
jgi:hypothetical protein